MTAISPPSSTLPERPILIAFLLFIVVGGGGAVAVRITYSEMDPFWMAGSRFSLGALMFWMLVAYRKTPLPKGRALLGAVIYGTLTVGIAFMLVAWGLVATPASLYQVLMAMVPLFTIFLSALHGIEAITRRGLLGSLLAVAGIVVTVWLGGFDSSNISIPHIIGIMVAAVFISEGGVIIKKFPPNPPILTNAIAMTVGAIFLMVASLVSGETWNIPTHTNTWIAYIYMVFFVTFLTFMLYMFVLSRWTASGTSYGFVLFPLVTIVVAAVLGGEKITIYFLIGAAFVLAGVLVGALLPTKTKSEAIEECKDRSGQVVYRCV